MTEAENLGQNVDSITLDGRKIYLVGTAHVSHSSAELAEKIIREIRPDTVAVELCESRYASLKDPDRWKNTDLVTVIREGKAYVLMAQLMLSGFQKKLGKKLNIKPGAEMLRAVQVAEELKARTVLADREIRTTLKRTWASLGLWSICKLLWSMFSNLFSTEEITQEEIEKLKNADALDEVMKEFSKALPQVRIALIDERDKYLAMKIKRAPGNSVVAIVGAGHVPGIKQWIQQDLNLAPLDEIPKGGMTGKIFSWGIPALVVGMIVYGFFHSGSTRGIEMLSTWFFITACFGALGSALALAHPLSTLSAFLATPFTTLHPLLAAGWISGLVEAIIRKPRVLDLETVADDMGTVSGWWKNRVSRVLLVIAFTNITATIGALIGIKEVASLV